VVSHGAVIHPVAFQARDELLIEREKWQEEHIVKVALNGRYQMCYSIHIDKYSKYSLHPSTFVYVYYVSEATRMTGYGPD
jgi:hypothetical protein